MKPTIHPNTPPRLRAAFRRAKNMRGEGYKIDVLAKQLGVNIYYLFQLIKKGIEPNDTTNKLQAVRVKMFLPRKKRRPSKRKQTEPLPEHLRWWRSLPKESRNEIVMNLHESRRIT